MILDSHSHALSFPAVVNLPLGELPQPGFRYSAGIHPWNVGDIDSSVWQWIEHVVDLPEVVAIGESGLDALCGADMENQILVFGKMVEISERVRKPLIIHCVRAWNHLFSVYKDMKPSQPWIIHGFRGKPELARRLLGCGFYLSYGSRFNVESLCLTPDSHLLVESDEGSFNDSLAAVAAARGVTVSRLKDIVRENNLCVFG